MSLQFCTKFESRSVSYMCAKFVKIRRNTWEMTRLSQLVVGWECKTFMCVAATYLFHLSLIYGCTHSCTSDSGRVWKTPIPELCWIRPNSESTLRGFLTDQDVRGRSHKLFHQKNAVVLRIITYRNLPISGTIQSFLLTTKVDCPSFSRLPLRIKLT